MKNVPFSKRTRIPSIVIEAPCNSAVTRSAVRRPTPSMRFRIPTLLHFRTLFYNTKSNLNLNFVIKLSSNSNLKNESNRKCCLILFVLACVLAVYIQHKPQDTLLQDELGLPCEGLQTSGRGLRSTWIFAFRKEWAATF